MWATVMGMATGAAIVIVGLATSPNDPRETCVTEVYRQSRTAVIHERTCIWTVRK